MAGPIPYRILKPVPGEWYVCEQTRINNSGPPMKGPPVPERDRCISDGFKSESEAKAAAAEIEAKHPYYKARTEVWPAPLPLPPSPNKCTRCYSEKLVTTACRNNFRALQRVGAASNLAWESTTYTLKCLDCKNSFTLTVEANPATPGVSPDGCDCH